LCPANRRLTRVARSGTAEAERKLGRDPVVAAVAALGSGSLVNEALIAKNPEPVMYATYNLDGPPKA